MEHNREHGGTFTTEKGFRKHFPDMYDEMCRTKFPPFFDNFSFKQKLWHFLHDDYNEHICSCGGKLNFRSFWYGYNTFCRMNCPSMVENQVRCVKAKNMLKTPEDKRETQRKVVETFLRKYGVERYSKTDEWREKTIRKNREKFGCDWSSQSQKHKEDFRRTSIEKYGVENPFQSEECKEKSKRTCLEKYGKENHAQTDEHKKKVKETCIRKYGAEHYNKTDEFKEKFKNTCMKKYGVDNYSKSNEYRNRLKEKYSEIRDKVHNTKKRNNSFNTSAVERLFAEYLERNGVEFIRQHKDDAYPFNCDFYIPEHKLYVEIQGTWTHGGHPFDPENPGDLTKLDTWRSKNTKYYDNAIYVWTDLDMRKRLVAKENGLNHLEIFSSDIDGVITAFENHIKPTHHK